MSRALARLGTAGRTPPRCPVPGTAADELLGSRVVGELERGLYEELVTERLRPLVDSIDPTLRRQQPLDAAEAPDRIALHLARQVELALASLGDTRRVEAAVA